MDAMEKNQITPETPQPAASAESRDQEAFAQFMTPLANLKELDLTDIEPLLPPTYRESRYSVK